MSDLRHHGIKGQKWGVRRFQNADGSLTATGRKRYGTDDLKDSLDKLNKADSLINTAKKYQSEKDRKEHNNKVNNKIKSDLSKMSDKELQQVVNRLNLEERYTQVMKSREKDAGESAAMKWLNVAGTVVTVSASAMAMAIQIKQLME